MWFDIAVAAVAAVENGVESADFATRHGLGGVGWLIPVFLLGAASGATLLVRRRWPLLPVLVALVCIPVQMGYMQLVIGLYTLAAYRPTGLGSRFGMRRLMTVVCGVAIAETVIVSVVRLAGTSPGMNARVHAMPWYVLVIISGLGAVGLTVPPVMIGMYVGARRRLWESLRERAEGLETELALLADQARERARRARMEERTRIAREMHDVVAHRVSLMVVHAAAVERIVAKDPEKAAQSARLMGDVGRQALDELRQILGVLRSVDSSADEEPARGPAGDGRVDGAAAGGLDGEAGAAGRAGSTPPAAAAGSGATAVSTAPADTARQLLPGLAGLTRVVDESRAAGLNVRLTVGGARRVLSEETERTAYRVVQEALTNVLKHAPGAATEVVVAYVPNGVALAVSNECPDGEAAKDGPEALPSGGNGLIGMRERVTALGGAFDAGPTAEGGFRVEARLLARA
ncbi:sensor histidine kinase [Phaeacidiphilus oryzae]|uniref:sensor histidine kinase n=1 Tax=Phaeacidiphilus oryzae TaxID=348818 RepID=UPI0005673459|nr:histidine kinase [Phaeacidiphilus oryzae]